MRRLDFGPLPPKDWALDGTGGGTGRSRQVWTWAMGKATDPGVRARTGTGGPSRDKFDRHRRAEARHEQSDVDDAETVVVSFGTAAKFVEYVVDELRAEGHRIGWFRPVTLWPFPGDALAGGHRGTASRVLVFELNAGQMLDDVRMHAADRSTGAVHRRREHRRVRPAPTASCSTRRCIRDRLLAEMEAAA